MAKYKLVTWGLGLIIVGGVSGFIVSRLTRANWNMDGWGANQWGSAAAWFGGILTATAVSVSLSQAREARKTAAAEQTAAAERLTEEKRRHDSQLERAENRLTRQIATTRRLEQLRSIPPIWEEIRLLNGPAIGVVSAISNLNALATEKMKSQQYLTDTDRDELLASVNTWGFAYSAVETAFSTALMLVDESNVERQLAILHRRLHSLHNEVLSATHASFRARLPDPQPIRDALQRVREVRDPMVNAVRIHLADAQPFQYVNDDVSTESLYFTLPKPATNLK